MSITSLNVEPLQIVTIPFFSDDWRKAGAIIDAKQKYGNDTSARRFRPVYDKRCGQNLRRKNKEKAVGSGKYAISICASLKITEDG